MLCQNRSPANVACEWQPGNRCRKERPEAISGSDIKFLCERVGLFLRYSQRGRGEAGGAAKGRWRRDSGAGFFIVESLYFASDPIIRPPREGGDGRSRPRGRRSGCFNPRPREGGDPVGFKTFSIKMFNSRIREPESRWIKFRRNSYDATVKEHEIRTLRASRKV